MRGRVTRTTGILALLLAAVVTRAQTDGAAVPMRGGHPDLSGYWNLSVRIPRDPQLMAQLPPHTVVLDDTGPVELPPGDFGGLQIKPRALAAAHAWKPLDDMTLSKACKAPSIIYAMQGPFPIEVYQGTEFIIIKLEYFDMVRIIFMDGRPPPANIPDTATGYSVGRWEGNTLVVETTHLEAATITNNGLDHSNKVRVLERFRLGEGGQTLLSTQEFEDPEVLDGPGARFIAWRRKPGQHITPYECDPSFVVNYQQAQDAPNAAPAPSQAQKAAPGKPH
jgi:hypothetical protein